MPLALSVLSISPDLSMRRYPLISDKPARNHPLVTSKRDSQTGEWGPTGIRSARGRGTLATSFAVFLGRIPTVEVMLALPATQRQELFPTRAPSWDGDSITPR